MKFQKACICLGGLSLLVAVAPSFALTRAEKVTPQWTKENGITVATQRRDDGTIGFTVTRYLDASPTSSTVNDSELMAKYTARLELNLDSVATPDLKTTVAGEEENGAVTYFFALSPLDVASTHFSLDKFLVYKDPAKEKIPIIGGVLYEFDLNEFAALAKPNPR